MKYIAVRSGGWHDYHFILHDVELKEVMNDGSFDDDWYKDGEKWKFYELGKEITKTELKELANGHQPNP